MHIWIIQFFIIKYHQTGINFKAMNHLVLLLSFLISLSSIAQQNADILIKNGRILDGTGNSWFWGDIAIKEGKILKIGKSITSQQQKPLMQKE